MSLLLGWPTYLEAKRKATANKVNAFMQKQNQKDLSYSIQYNGDGHLVTIAPTGSGKGVAVIIPNLLHYAGPIIVIDPKGENFAVTARYRTSLGQKIILLDPFKAVPDQLLEFYGVQRGRLNPLDLCQLSGASITNDAQMIANLLSGDGSLNTDPYWDINGKKLLSGLIAHEMDMSQRENRQPKFGRIVDMLFSDDVIYNLAVMLDTQKPSSFVSKTVGSGFLSITDKTRDGILTTAQSYLTTMTSGDLIEFLENSTIKITDIQNDEDYTLYIVIPPNKLESHSFILRIWVAVLMNAVMERKQLPNKRTLFMLDECANLGEMDVLRKAVTLLRGYGLQVWMFFQDLSQMESLYLEYFKTMINNCGVFQTFGVSRLSAAGPITKIVGTFEDKDVLNLDETQQIVSLSPGNVRIARLFKYYKDDAFKGRFDKNPLIKNDKRIRISNRLIRFSSTPRFS